MLFRLSSGLNLRISPLDKFERRKVMVVPVVWPRLGFSSQDRFHGSHPILNFHFNRRRAERAIAFDGPQTMKRKPFPDHPDPVLSQRASRSLGSLEIHGARIFCAFGNKGARVDLKCCGEGRPPPFLQPVPVRERRPADLRMRPPELGVRQAAGRTGRMEDTTSRRRGCETGYEGRLGPLRTAEWVCPEKLDLNRVSK
jgi:hypothetical protein